MARSSLVPDLSDSLSVLRETFGTAQSRADAKQRAAQQQAVQKDIDILSGETLTPAEERRPGGGAPLQGPTPKQEEAALIRIAAFNPQMSNAIRQIRDRGDQLEAQQALAETEKGTRQAILIQRQPDFISKQRALTQAAQEASSRGEDISRFVELSNLAEPQLDLELQKMVIQGTDIKTLLTPQKGFTLSPGQVRFGPGGEPIAGVPKTVTPSTPIGQARQDLKSNLITQSEFNQISKTPAKFQTSVGKLIADKKLAVDTFGKDSEQVKAIDAALKSEVKGEPVSLSDIGGIRKEFTKASGDFVTVRDARNKVLSASPTAQGDIALIFNFMKVLDPGSTVREGEFATAENAAGIPQRVRVQFNKALEGDKLDDSQRAAFKSEVETLFNTQLKTQIQLEDEFRSIAGRANILPEDVVIDFVGDSRVNEIVVDF